MSTYLIHSAKGTSLSNHKYIKKVGNKYYYKNDGRLNSKDVKVLADDVKSGKYGTGTDLRAALGNHYGQVTYSIASKFKKPSSSSKSSSSSSSSSKNKEKSTSSKSSSSKSSTNTKEKSAKNTNEVSTKSSKESVTTTDKTTEHIQNIKDTISSIVDLADNDSYQIIDNNDGTSSINITYEDGSTQTITVNSKNEAIKVGQKIKPKENEAEHADMSMPIMWNEEKGLYHNTKAHLYKIR